MTVVEPPAPALWEVAVALPLAHTLTYRLPSRLLAAARVGSLVRVPVGRLLVTGYLLAPTRETPPGTLRDIRKGPPPHTPVRPGVGAPGIQLGSNLGLALEKLGARRRPSSITSRPCESSPIMCRLRSILARARAVQ